MLKSVLQLSIIFFLLSLGACKKENNNPTTTLGSDFFVEGKGLRKVWGMLSPTVGIGGFGLTQFTYTPDGFIHTVFTSGKPGINGAPAEYVGHRKKINLSSGDTLATTGIPSFISREYLGASQSGCLGYGLVPYTDKFVYQKGAAIEGDPNWQSLPFASTFAKIYDTRQAVCYSTYVSIDPYINVAYFTNNTTSPNTPKAIGKQTLCASVELTPNGDPLAFVAQKTDSLQVYNFKTNTLLASISLPLFLQYIPANYPSNHRPTANLITKRSQDGTKVIGIVYHAANYLKNGNARVLSTFVYDIATNTFKIKVQNAFIETGFYVTTTEDFDDKSNFYYMPPLATGGKLTINKITPTGGDVAYKTDFIKNGGGTVIAVKSAMNKVFVVCSTVDNNTYTNDRGKGTILIMVAE